LDAKHTIQSYGLRSKTYVALFSITKIEFGYSVTFPIVKKPEVSVSISYQVKEQAFDIMGFKVNLATVNENALP